MKIIDMAAIIALDILNSHKSINVDSPLDVLLCDLVMKNPSLLRNK